LRPALLILPRISPSWAAGPRGGWSFSCFLLSFCIVTAVVLTFGQVVTFDLLRWDDPVNITRNPLLNPPSLEHALAFWLAPYAGLYVPVTYTFWSLEAALALLTAPSAGQLNPAVFHAGNLILHALTAIALFWLLRLLVHNIWAACAGALLFAVHPIQAESVAWVTETKGLLCGLWSFLALSAYVKFATLPGDKLRWRITWYVLATLCFVLALLSKPSAVVVPAVALVLDRFALGRSWRSSLRTLAFWFLVAVVPMVITKRLQPDEFLADVPGLGQRLFVAADAVGFYLVKLFWPLGLAPDYGRSPRVALATPWPYVAGTILAVLIGFLTLLRLWRSLIVLVLFIIGLLPVLGLVPFSYQQFSTVADRYAYVAMLAPALGLAWLLSAHPRRGAFLAVLALIVALAAVGHVQANYWRDDHALYLRALEVNPRSLLANNGLGNLLATQGRWIDAARYYQAAVESDANSYSAHYNLGRALARLNQGEEAVLELARSIELRPDYEKAHLELARVYAGLGRLPLAKEHLSYITRTNPSASLAWYNLGEVCVALNQPDEALRAFGESLKLAPTADVHEQLGRLLEAQGRRSEAIEHYRQALTLEPNRQSVRTAIARLAAGDNP
jgi:tetratricopeptide (TPR) repeat protein